MVVLMVACLSSCQVSRYLESDEVLYDKVEVKLNNKEPIDNTSDLKEALYWATRPKPNKKWLGLMRLNLWAHYQKEVNKKSKSPWWLRSIREEEPVLLDSILVENNCRRMETYLFNHGYYESEVNYATKLNNNFAKVTYLVNIAEQFRVDSVIYTPTKNPHVNQLISSTTTKISANVKKGDPFNADALQAERQRISNVLHNNGYFDFDKNYITFRIDSFHQEQKVNLYVDIDSTKNFPIYNIQDIYILSDVTPGSPNLDTTMVKGYHFIDSDKTFKPLNIVEKIKLKKGAPYSANDYQKTFDNLLEMSVFKFVNIRFNEMKDSLGNEKLDCYIFLTPLEKMKYSVEAELNDRFTENPLGEGAIGTALTANLLNRNLFGGGERFAIGLFGGIEFNLFNNDDKTPIINTVNLSGETSLTVPKFILPFPKLLFSRDMRDQIKSSKVSTVFRLSDDFVRIVGSYSINATELSYGFDWQPNQRTRHILTPISLAYSSINNVESSFDSLLVSDLRLQKSFENRLIIGGSYSYINTNRPFSQKNKYFFRADLELAGNMMYFLERGLQSTNLMDRSFAEIFGLEYSQFVRLQADYRYHWQLNTNSSLVARVYGGIGVPYANSNVLPYIRQFFSGGSTGVRAFRIRGLGPGSFKTIETEGISNPQFANTGDMKLEANLEYRFHIYWFLKGAVFLDAGNVWTLQSDPTKVGAEFRADRFYKEFGLGTGFGLRFDFSFFILRFDLATPLYKPFLQEGNRWDTQFAIGQKAWRQENMVLQFGIGYPF